MFYQYTCPTYKETYRVHIQTRSDTGGKWVQITGRSLTGTGWFTNKWVDRSELVPCEDQSRNVNHI